MGSKRYARTKGHNFEREVVNQLKVFFPNIRRRMESVPGTNNGVDMDESGPFKIQAKAFKKSVPMSKIEEIKEEGIPLLISKTNGKQPMVTMYFEDFKVLLGKAGYNEGK